MHAEKFTDAMSLAAVNTLREADGRPPLESINAAVVENNARAVRLREALRLLPLFVLHVGLLVWAAGVFSLASAYQVTLNAWRDGRRSLSSDEAVVISAPGEARRE